MSLGLGGAAVVVEDVGVDVAWQNMLNIFLSINLLCLTLESCQLGQDEGGEDGVGHHHGGGGGGLGRAEAEEDETGEEEEDGLKRNVVSYMYCHVRWWLLTVSCMVWCLAWADWRRSSSGTCYILTTPLTRLDLLATSSLSVRAVLEGFA